MTKIINLIEKLYDRVNVELDHLRLNLNYVIACSLVGFFALMILRPSMEKSFWITLGPWLVSAYFLFDIKRFIHLHVAGELLELMQVAVVKPTAQSEATSVLDNDTSRLYLRIITGIFAAETFLFLALPLYINYTAGGNTTMIVIAMVAVIVAIGSAAFFTKLFRFGVAVTVILYVLGLTFVLFPQLGFYSKLEEKVRYMPLSSAIKVREINSLREKQREQINNELLSDALKWQEQNPGQELPFAYREVIDAAAENLTVEQYRQKKQSSYKATNLGSNVKLANLVREEAFLTGKITYNHWDPQNLGAVKIATLQPGEYTIVFDGINRQLVDGPEKVIAVPPAGRVGVVLANQHDFPVPSAAPGSRLIKIDNGPWMYAGPGMKFDLTQKSDVLVTINARQENPFNFTGNTGEDRIIIKRGGQ